jgi:ADP-heptose:LPS heptosyltransferase
VILSLDADEYLSDKLTESILKVKQNWVGHAYSMNRLSSYGGKWIKHGNWYPDTKIRLWDRKVGNWGGENPHDRVVINRATKIVHLKGDLLHKAYLDSHDTIQKVQRYSEIFARENRGKKTSSSGKIIFRTFFAFIKSYVIKRGFLDGFEGLMVAMAVANHVFYKYAKLHELNTRLELGKKVIISRTDNLGDVILTLPLVGYLKSIDPTLKVYFIGKGYTKAIIEKSVFVDEFLDRDLILANPSILEKVDSKNIIFVFPDRQLVSLAKKIGIENRIATRHRWYNWLYSNFLVEFSRVNSPLHESQLNFKLLKPFKLNEEMELGEMPKYFGLVSEPRNFDSLLSRDKFNLIIHPKSKNSAREWHLNNYYQLLNLLPHEYFKIFITGLKEEGDVIRNELPEFLSSSQVTDLTGRFSLDELISFINQADGLVACSTGVLHLASALGKRTVGIYSPMRPFTQEGGCRWVGIQIT